MSGLRQIIEALRGLIVWWVTVAPWEQAIRVRLGRRVSLLPAGVHLRIPVVDRVYRQSVRLRSSIQPAQTLVTRDGKPLTIAVTVLYRIADLRRLYDTVHHPEGTISAMVLGAVGRFVVEHDARDCGPGVVCREVPALADLQRFGLEDVEVTVNTFAFVRTYRLITGDGHAWSCGDVLNTDTEVDAG